MTTVIIINIFFVIIQQEKNVDKNNGASCYLLNYFLICWLKYLFHFTFNLIVTIPECRNVGGNLLCLQRQNTFLAKYLYCLGFGRVYVKSKLLLWGY